MPPAWAWPQQARAVPGCKVDCRSPQFNQLCKHWKSAYPHIERDLEEAFKAIRENVEAKNCRVVPRHGTGVTVHKYRQNSSDIGRGASYGWRIQAIYDRQSGVLYPILVYPKTAWQDASDETIVAAINELLAVLTPKHSAAIGPPESTPAHACPNCGPAVFLVRISDVLECPDCQRAYREVVTESGATELQPVIL